MATQIILFDSVSSKSGNSIAHTANICMEWLREKFPGKVISKKGDVEWPARSPDLNPPDFYLWGYLKEDVFRSTPRTLPELKANIVDAVRRVSTETLRNTVRNFAQSAESGEMFRKSRTPF